MLRRSLFFVIIFCLSLSLHAKNNTLTIVYLQGADINLPELPSRIVNWDMPYENSYLYSVSGVKNISSYNYSFIHAYVGLEGVIGLHRGVSNNLETAAAINIRFEKLFPVKNSMVEFDYSIGEGFSYIFGKNRYEDPPKNNPNKHYSLLNFISMDFDIYSPSFSQLHLVFRLHHRSGVYGLIAPQKVGSNYVGCGVRYIF